ncbi:anthranilate synthase component I family protein [Paenibacillus hunanensis]|uniref:anthranilate synthase component I family protein n=1 Tax=Paenibacillus hunanensis TaxID=539262 RepID=UPI0020275C6A|nr:anthranilate synthase component I family protein [Paenibacillus hunanensis]MCL9663407.1 anthranilate synthase component I family protein [Paenibacillus hunanensis]
MTRVCISLQQWEQWSREGYTHLPYLLRIPLHEQLLPASWEVLWSEQFPHSVLLENGKGGRYTYLGLQPSGILSGDLEQAEEQELSVDWTGEVASLSSPQSSAESAFQQTELADEIRGMKQHHGKPLDVLRQWMSSYRAPRVEAAPPFIGGCAGFLSYDISRSLERLPNRLPNELGLPEYVWLRFDQLWVVDHLEKELYCCVHLPVALVATDTQADEAVTCSAHYEQAAMLAEQMAQQWQKWLTTVSKADTQRRELLQQHPAALTDSRTEGYGFTTGFEQQAFQQAVQSVQRYIGQGDVFQVNLSLRSERAIEGTPESIYEWLRLTNPSPYMGLLRLPGFQLVSASPELLVSVRDGAVAARPIAGTRRRGTTEQEDLAMEQELLQTEKERAEHIMLVDLQRNDLGRIARYGSVRVPELMTIERYSHVMHLVSGVEAELAEDKDVYDVIAATFPGGTITGAPKIRTMEIIEELEQTRRGAYTGSMGWIDYSGNMELNIIIRTLTVKDNIAYMQAGAGIVIDSDPYREYRECFNKSRALARAVMLSEQQERLRQEREEQR